ncbi:bifunctional 4-hydroxy-2-oxoglutarate aldolase/2-dehydro-3-deoxy-phosphogluconate aldolase [Dactylosporangium aurantiacum]|uniref:Bifunctional 4-hydroxy-2-oxoglutarate aldolase/2-dehydro-3-deoxy-phosphogluconate aldolase n=1 Tax=Dactylosporangium aurantiacum TaxID=35754 RepID=A0A9Q9IRP7_9ACTN|nr:bifunctional 4-hydroxy-2-oxoglutarate aldolase/2-dehydro-3-deoxy-phosphogluconate aldolase [Dactylosporangium aurantiacum]MDG6106356.1 bifunctional 4-hydroxy-2-oxoglutarate aldolase/2-dehydro-3-deoxy-phosphogluconate aldolase [Dactylosporangium aurantiacum]UWZ58155.1 bifunctional 4-hydroxy-2-oxoglutarate aldolase/2-dehydro-3-deoxy-phosphogluconate aldolase [Dactylosporangium aurantiacum]
MTFDELLRGRPLLAILRGVPLARAVPLADAVHASGLGVVEVPIQTPDAVDVLRDLASRGTPVGAGTVRTVEQVAVAAAAGAAFTVAPGFDAAVAGASHAAGLPHLPGVATATDVHHALTAGCTWLKAFPAGSLGPGWLRELRGPFPEARFVATGGIDAGNAGSFLAAGAVAVGVGTAVTREGGLAALLRAFGEIAVRPGTAET